MTDRCEIAIFCAKLTVNEPSLVQSPMGPDKRNRTKKPTVL